MRKIRYLHTSYFAENLRIIAYPNLLIGMFIVSTIISFISIVNNLHSSLIHTVVSSLDTSRKAKFMILSSYAIFGEFTIIEECIFRTLIKTVSLY